MDKCNCYHSTTVYQQKIQPWAEKISAAQMENIKKNGHFSSAIVGSYFILLAVVALIVLRVNSGRKEG